MKHYYTLLLLVILLVSGCGKKEEDPAPELIGKWAVVKVEHSAYNMDGTFNSTYLSPNADPTTVVFTADSMISQIPFLRREPYKATYTRQGKVLDVVYRNQGSNIEQYVYVIEELTDKQLVYYGDEFWPAYVGGKIRFRRRYTLKR